MALGALAAPSGNLGFDAEGTATVPISAGSNTIKIKSPLENVKDTFADMRDSLASMVGIQTREEKRQAAIDEKLLAQKDFEIEMQNKKFEEEGMQGPRMPTSNDDLEGVDTDDKTYGNFVEKAETAGGNILDSIKDAFDQTSFGEKMMAVILAGGFLLFSKYSDTIQKYLEPIVQFLMDTIDFLGPEGAFAAFIGGFILLKSGLAKKIIVGAGSKILKGIKASAAAIDRQGGLLKAMGNGFERINKGAGSLVGKLKSMGTMITGGLTKGFTMLGNGLKALRIGIVSMSSSLGSMIVPFLPVIAIAAAAVAVFFSLKSGFETFKQSLDDGDSMFTAVIKGLGDAMLTLVTLPATLVKKLVGFIAGLFGFDNFKEQLESFSIKDAIVNTFKRLTGGMVNIIKAIAKGAAAALAAALPGGETPQEAFAKAYAEVMAGGNADTATDLEGTSDFQGSDKESSIKAANEVYDEKGFNKMDTSEMGGDLIGGTEGQGTGNAVTVSYYAKQAAEEARIAKERESGYTSMGDKTFESKFPNTTQGAEGSDDFGGAVYDENGKKIDYLAEMIANTSFEQKLTTTRTLKENGQITGQSKSTVVVKGGNVTGDTVNQMSETNITGELQVNNTEHTQKIIQEHF